MAEHSRLNYKRASWFERVLIQDAEEVADISAIPNVLQRLSPERQAELLKLGQSRIPVGASNAHDSGQTTEWTHNFIEMSRHQVSDSIRGDVTSGMPGMGLAYTMDGVPEDELEDWMPENQHTKRIGELPATAICGNDITASCFYVVGELAKNAGIYSPFCTMLSSMTLYCFRSIYGEVVTALPLNGGIYNLLLNSSSKRTASVAACLTVLSYTATGVVSSVSAADYLGASPLFEGIMVVPTAISILGFFAGLMLLGMNESSVVASMLFVFHLSVLFILVIFCLFFLYEVGLGQFYANLHWPNQPPPFEAIFFGFSSAMLGVSGFETSANFVEEQKPGVFPKTLFNMWLSVSLINISLPLLAVMILPLDDLTGEESAYAVAYLAERVAGPFLRDIVAIDALLVLAGSVLTSYVGVCGLFQRMSGDRCLPEFFATTNQWRGTPHYTITVFFCVCSSMCILLNGNITLLAAIYSISFLLVMGLFAFCGLWMKVKRPTLPRQINTDASMFGLGLIFVGCAFTAVVLLHPDVLTYFYLYYGLTTFMVMTTFARSFIFTAFLRMMSNSRAAQFIITRFVHMDVAQHWILAGLKRLRNQGVVYFTRTANLSQINMALQYIEENEEARWVRVIHVYSDPDEIPPHLLEYVQLLDCVYPKIRIDCILVQGEFGPAIVKFISQQIDVRVNCMFINCPKTNFQHTLDNMGGTRVIQNSEKGSILDGLKPMTPLK
eukprot:NODE_1217_length_2556_cov_18.228489.p1 GENE.NODE_1217_length_2556_cov_18.228489~~NODE_1217_length_2556_cov_18.228489.p1  ORF type:complete len:724 (-),score=208.07 NODE_1217_length_2556_cov_18.228489:152-2323(-)